MDIRLKFEDIYFSWILACSIRNQNKIIEFVIGGYSKHELKVDITSEIAELVRGIRRKHSNPNILVFGDLNTNKRDSIEKIEDIWKLLSSKQN